MSAEIFGSCTARVDGREGGRKGRNKLICVENVNEFDECEQCSRLLEERLERDTNAVTSLAATLSGWTSGSVVGASAAVVLRDVFAREAEFALAAYFAVVGTGATVALAKLSEDGSGRAEELPLHIVSNTGPYWLQYRHIRDLFHC